MKKLITRFHHTGLLFLIGLFLIIYIAFGFTYLQQGSQQKNLGEQITNISAVVSRPPPSGEELQAEYEEVNVLLAPMTDRDAIALFVGIAEASGIDIDPDNDKFRIPPAALSQTKVGGGTYRLLSFKNIHVQGDYEDVMAFISDLDSGKTLPTMVLKRVDIREKEAKATGEEGDRRVEFRSVVSAVIAMMDGNSLSAIPNPMNFADGVATNLMGDDSYTTGTVEGFTDITITAADKA